MSPPCLGNLLMWTLAECWAPAATSWPSPGDRGLQLEACQTGEAFFLLGVPTSGCLCLDLCMQRTLMQWGAHHLRPSLQLQVHIWAERLTKQVSGNLDADTGGWA